MDITQLASVAVALLTPYVVKGAEEFAKEMGKGTAEKAKALLGKLRDRFKSDENTKAQQTLTLLGDDPETFKEALTKILVEELESAPDFAGEVARLVGEADQAAGGKFRIHIERSQGIVIGDWAQVIQHFGGKAN